MIRKSSQPKKQMKLAGSEFALAEKVAFLSRPEAYGSASGRVETVETHMSWVFLTEEFAHKLKKPVRYDFLDFRSLEARRHSCEEEIRLNRRLAPEVYIETIPLVADAAGDLNLGGEGEPVDWLVRMHRLPAVRMLDRAIQAGTIQGGDLLAVARLLADFYGGAAALAMPADEYRGRLAVAILQNKEVLENPDFALPTAMVTAIYEGLGKMLVRNGTIFEERVHGGCVVEGHGDLRPEHVYLGPGPAVIDCLEFKRDFRILDRADELAYLAMECERLGSPAAGTEILETCCRLIGDEPVAELIDFYKAHRAFLRARLAILHLRDEEVRDRQKWRPRTLEYLALAEAYARRLT
jgi:aminoglycoside phosphotransferase family enzyme